MLLLTGVDFRYCFWLNWGSRNHVHPLCTPWPVCCGSQSLVVRGYITAFVLLYLFLRWAKNNTCPRKRK
ncbi:MAG: hypothetical protein R2860_09465 [Desulfobacterales bacterium]